MKNSISIYSQWGKWTSKPTSTYPFVQCSVQVALATWEKVIHIQSGVMESGLIWVMKVRVSFLKGGRGSKKTGDGDRGDCRRCHEGVVEHGKSGEASWSRPYHRLINVEELELGDVESRQIQSVKKRNLNLFSICREERQKLIILLQNLSFWVIASLRTGCLHVTEFQ